MDYMSRRMFASVCPILYKNVPFVWSKWEKRSDKKLLREWKIKKVKHLFLQWRTSICLYHSNIVQGLKCVRRDPLKARI